DYECAAPDFKGLVLFIHGNGCPLVQKRIPELKRLRESYGEKGFSFKMLNANLQDEREEIIAEAAEFENDFPILIDESQLVAEMMGLERTAETFLITADKSVAYRGAIDDRLDYQTEKPEATESYLEEAIKALAAGKEIAQTRTEAPGCKITLPHKESKKEISYVDDIAPLLKKKCVSCHTKGEIGPFSMSSYKKVKGWSEMMVETVLTRQMPPWHADPHIGKFSNDAGLTPEEARMLVHWVDAGSQRGDGPDPLEGYRPAKKEWNIGTPDMVIDLPEQTVPAEGIIDYRYVHVEAPNEEDIWVDGLEVKPGNTRVLHHVVVTTYQKEEGEKKERRRRREDWLTGYAPGTAAARFPEGTGVRIKKGTVMKFQLHYTASGKEETDLTQLGLFVRKEKPEKELKTDVIIHPRWLIPPHDPEYEQKYRKTISKDRILYAMNPHMHFRGKRMRFSIESADGEKETLLSVPNYNFNWQRTYFLESPIRIPAGSKLIIDNAWDNSKRNPSNPDPSKRVHWGQQSFDEMFFATLSYTEAD
ncbi:MAG: redoxin family protein, partial [Verrucomicrobiota bacterium]